jgi:hypothetical protein
MYVAEGVDEAAVSIDVYPLPTVGTDDLLRVTPKPTL